MIPGEMLTAGRPALQDFQPDEKLFYRLQMGFQVGEHPAGLDIRSPEFSVNRGGHGGKPEYVLLPSWQHFGIAEFRVCDTPSPLVSDGGTTFTFEVVHAPEPQNYFHSEVCSFKNGERCRKSSQLSTQVKREFRQRLAEKMVVINAFNAQGQCISSE